MVEKTYSGKDVKRFAGLSGVRKRSSVYIGPNDNSGLWTIVREAADNFCDLATKGMNKKGHVIFDPDKKAYWVLDEGPGFPVEVHSYTDEHGKKEKLNTFYVQTGLTHGGTNFDSDQISRGVNGVGIKCSNAMSKVFIVWTFKDGDWYSIHYRDAKLFKDVTKEKPPKLPFGIKPTRGSIIYIEPDMSLFVKGTKLDRNDIMQWAEISSYLVPQVEVKITNTKGKATVFKSKGLQEYLTNRLTELQADQQGKPFIFHSEHADVAISFANAPENSVRAYTNGLFNASGGKHIDAVFSALMKSLKPYKGKLEFTPKDLQDGLVGLVNVKLAAPLFSSQTKELLIDTRATQLCADPVFKALEVFWKANKTLAQAVCKRASELRKLNIDFQADRNLTKKARASTKGMSDKFADVSNKKTPIEERELYIVEGDSAGGTAKKARHKEYQATFAIRGKPLNIMDAKKDKIHSNKEVVGIMGGIGLGSGKDDEINFGKIIFLADPDVDGYHINCLLLAMFWKIMPKLFYEGKIYILKSPEYWGEIKGKTYYGMTIEDLYKNAGTSSLKVNHVKGWGELTPERMAPIAFDKETRMLIQILPPKDKKGEERFRALMGTKADYRKQLMGIVG